MKYLNDLQFDGKRVLMRVDFNVPLDKDFNITDFTRIKAAVPSIKKILADGGSLVLMSHLGRPKNGPETKFSLKHIVSDLSKHIGVDVEFAGDCIGEKAFQMSSDLKKGGVLLLENLRFYPEEKKGDLDFAKKLSQHADVYVNDAFGTAHRAHASTATVAQFFDEKACGYVMQNEVENAQKVLNDGEKPLVAIMGGAKISDKILIIENLLDSVDHLIIGGGMAYTFCKAMGGTIGNSLVEEDKIELAKELIQKAKDKNVNLLIPEDSIVADNFSNEANTQDLSSTEIPDGWMGLDIGSKASEAYKEVILASKTILWNGPMGVFEMSKFAQGTIQIAHAVVEATKNGAFSLIGGGDSAAAVNSLGFGDDVSYVSTGGGALLEYMEGKELPGIKALS